MRGQHKGKVGTIDKVDIKQGNITLDSLFTTKRDGSKSFYPINPSNVMVQEINLDDRKRKEKLQKKVTKK
jgi:large subunit ribosomal protein L24